MSVDDIVKETHLVAMLQTSDQGREQAQELLRLVHQARTEGASPSFQATIAKQQKQLLTNISHLRGLHRAACIAARDTKGLTTDARQHVDRLQLELQNLYYEQQHLQDETAACESYDHSYTKLPLTPVHEFIAQHPEHADDDETELMVARIDHERVEREALEQQRQELLKRKQKLIAENKRRKDDLANLDKDLEKFIDAAKPIMELFEKAP